MRSEIREWKSLALALDELEPSDDPNVQRVAEMAERLGHSLVLQYGYGNGEAVLAAHRLQPLRLKPFIDAACQFNFDQLRGTPDAAGVNEAVKAQNILLSEVRDIVATQPKDPDRA